MEYKDLSPAGKKLADAAKALGFVEGRIQHSDGARYCLTLGEGRGRKIVSIGKRKAWFFYQPTSWDPMRLNCWKDGELSDGIQYWLAHFHRAQLHLGRMVMPFYC